MRWLITALVAGFLWPVVLAIVRPQTFDGYAPPLDLQRCYAEPSVRYWDGELGYRRPRRSDFHSVLVCWPKHGVFMNGQAALSWDARGVKR